MIYNSIIVSLTILGFHTIIDFILSDWFGIELTDVYDRYSGRWQLYLLKPLFLCPTCMTSIWGISMYFLLYEDLTYLFFHIGTVGFFNFVLSKRIL